MTRSTLDTIVVSEISVPPAVSLVQHDERWILIMRRTFRQSPERLWDMLTDPTQLARWSPIVPDRPLTSAGPATSRENPGDEPTNTEVITVEAGHLLVHRWGADILRWTITPDGDGTLLELRQTFDDRTMASSYAGGWQVCFGALAANSGFTSHERVVGQRAMDYGWEQLRDAYDNEWEAPAAGE